MVLACVVILGIFIILVTAMPSGFYATSPEYEEYSVPEEWSISAIELEAAKYWGNTTVDYTFWGLHHDYLTIEREPDLDNIDIDICWRTWNVAGLPKIFYIWRYWYIFFGWYLVRDGFDPFPLYESEVRANIDDSGNFSRVDMNDDAFRYVVFFSYNSSLGYSNLEEALDDGHILIQIGQGIAGSEGYESYMMSGWELVGRLLTFDLPDIGIGDAGANALLNGIIALPLWILIVLSVFGLITMIIKSLPFT